MRRGPAGAMIGGNDGWWANGAFGQLQALVLRFLKSFQAKAGSCR